MLNHKLKSRKRSSCPSCPSCPKDRRTMKTQQEIMAFDRKEFQDCRIAWRLCVDLKGKRVNGPPLVFKQQ